MISICIVLALLIIDQITKYIAVHYLKELVTVPIIQNVLHMTYVENQGAAFSFFTGKRIVLTLFAIIVVAGLGYLLLRGTMKTKTGNIALMLVIAGALGNVIDRLFRGFVVDFIDFRVIGFPVFNIADICICVGAALLAIYIIFQSDKQEKGEQHAIDTES